jgi:hypothetical protein
MARFTTAGGSGDGTPGAPGAPGQNGTNGADGADGLDSLFLGTWNSVTEFLAVYQGGPVGLADGDWWAFVKDNANPNKIYVVREDVNSATGWVIDDNEHFVLPAGSQGDPGAPGADGADGADGSNGADALWDYLGEYNGGIVYGAGAVVTYGGQLWYRNVYTSAGYVPGVGNTYWDLLAAKGVDGADGDPGPQGDPGAPGADGNDGSPGLVYLGSYVSGNGYIANLAVVKGSDNNLYIATSSGGLGDPVGNTAEWAIFLPKGADGADGTDGYNGTSFSWSAAFDPGTTYPLNYVVSYQGSSYIKVGTETVGDFPLPTDATYWNLMASKGDTGADGSDAPTDRIYSGEFEAIIDETGTTTFDGNIVPSAATYSLGTAALPWQDIYVSAGSINIADNDMETDSVSIKNTEGYLVLSRGGLKITDNTNEFEVFQLNPNGTLLLKSNVTETTTNAALEIIGSLNGTSIDPQNTGVLLHLTGLRDSPSRIYNDSYGTGVYSAYIGRHARGTSEDPEGLIAGDVISRVGGNAFLSSGQFAPISNVRMDFVAKENQTATARGNEIQFWTTSNGATGPARSFTLESTGITFPDNTKQTTAAVAQVQSDWTQADDTELDYIKNKPSLPDLSGYGVPTVYNPVWSGTGLTYTGTPATGSYMKMGKMVTFRVKVLMTTVTNFGTGDYSLTLPFAPVANYAFRDGGLHDGGNHYSIMLDADPSNTTGRMYYNTSNGQDARFNHNSPKALSTTDYFYISGTYECV